MRIRYAPSVILALAAAMLLEGNAAAQAGGGWQGGYGPGPQGNTWGTGMPPNLPPNVPPASNPNEPDDIEIGFLYGTAAAYGLGMGAWIDAETGLHDPGLQFVPPVVLGVGAPVGVFFLDPHSMPRGMPAAISAGVIIGGGEGLGVWSYQFTSANSHDAWGFRGLSRSMTVGGALGGAGGYALGYFQEPSPKTSMFLGSSVVWGSVIGSMIGYGSSRKGLEYGQANESASIGGIVGYNLALGATAAISMVHIPSYESIGWMWIGGGIGAAAGLPIYLAYAGSEQPAKRGLVFQGITTALGVAAAGVFTSGSSPGIASTTAPRRSSVGEILAIGPMALPNGAGVQMTGILF